MREMSIDEAKKTGALAFFGEKYGDKVRVVSVESVSREFCGGTHVKNIGKIGIVKIVSESSVASGIRRIEAVSGLGAFKIIKDNEKIMAELTASLKIEPEKLVDKVTKLAEQVKTLEKEVNRLKKGEGAVKTGDLAGSAKEIKGKKVLITKLEGVEAGDMREIGDKLRDKLVSGVILLFSSVEDKTSYLCMVTKDLTAKVNAGNIIKDIAKLTGGSGGGRPDMAQGGAKKVDNMEKLLEQMHGIIEKML
jgi:alanyl-tRNA synthetase